MISRQSGLKAYTDTAEILLERTPATKHQSAVDSRRR